MAASRAVWRLCVVALFARKDVNVAQSAASVAWTARVDNEDGRLGELGGRSIRLSSCLKES